MPYKIEKSLESKQMLASQFYHKRIFLKKGLKQDLHPGVTITVGMFTDRLLHVKSLISFFISTSFSYHIANERVFEQSAIWY